MPTLPPVESGVTVLETDERVTGALLSLVLDQLLTDGGSAVWVDAHGHGTTQPLAQIAPSMRILDRIHIARAFTAWQHQSLLQSLAAEISDDTAVVVLPAVDRFYRSDDLARGDGERMLSAGVELVADIAATLDVPVLLTRHATDSFTEPVRDVADDVVRCEQTQFGPRFTGEEYETLVYPLGDGTVQTTLAFWKRILATRHEAISSATATPEVSAHGAY